MGSRGGAEARRRRGERAAVAENEELKCQARARHREVRHREAGRPLPAGGLNECRAEAYSRGAIGMEPAMSATRFALAFFALLLALPTGIALAQPGSAAGVEAGVRALEGRGAALEGRAAPTAAASASGPACRKIYVNAAAIPDGVTLTVTINGAVIGTYNKAAHSDLEGFMRPGANNIGLAFSAPGSATTGASLNCLPPLPATLRSIILELHPTAGQLRAETVVVLSAP